VAEKRYAEAIATAAEEAGVPISIAPNAHQGALTKSARQHIPQSLTVQGGPSIYLERSIISFNCAGRVTEEELAVAQAGFRAETGWRLEIKGALVVSTILDKSSAPQSEPALSNLPASREETSPEATDGTTTPVASTSATRSAPMNQHDAIRLAQQMV